MDKTLPVADLGMDWVIVLAFLCVIFLVAFFIVVFLLREGIKKQQLYVFVDLENLLSDTPLQLGIVNKVMGQMKSLTLKSRSANSVELTVEIKDSSVNFLKALLQ